MIPRSKLARRVATNARRSALASGRHYTTAVGEDDPTATTADAETEQPHYIRESAALETVKIIQRRIRKAERDERMDITTALTEVKTYMGGFTVPGQIRTANWWPGGPYQLKKKHSEPPVSVAYTPHTVFVAESRYPIRHDVGRPETVEQIVGVCREEDFPAVMERLNSERAPGGLTDMMDNARWPWMGEKKVKRTRWMDRDESLEEIMQKIDAADHLAALAAVADEQLATASVPTRSVESKMNASSGQLRATELLMPQGLGGNAQQRRVFHFSLHPRAQNGHPSKAPGSYEARKQIPASSWARPHKPSQDADDNVVPSYYVERKRQRSEIAERKEEEGGLMAELNAGILSDGLAAQTRVRDEKIPVEVRDLRKGTVVHPSGFEPPTPETEFHPAAAKAPTEDHPLIETLKQRWDERPASDDSVPSRPDYDSSVERELARRKYLSDQAAMDAAEVLVNPDLVTHPKGTSTEPAGTVSQLGDRTTSAQRAQMPTSSWDTPTRQQLLTRRQREENTREDVVPPYYIERKRQRASIAERKEEEGSLMAELNAGILSEGLAAEVRVREEKIPVEVRDPHKGTVTHPSGFEPPTPETEFHPTAAKVATEDDPIIATKKVPWHDSETIVSPNGNGKSNGNGKNGTSASSSARSLHTSAILRALAVSDSAFGLMSTQLMQSPEPVPVVAPLQKSDQQAVHYQQQQQQDLFELDEEADVNAMSDPEQADAAVRELREKYLPTLKAKPFWRPLVTVTTQTRPLALSIARLAHGLRRGLAFYAAVDPHDRKYGPSMGTRVRNMRMNRMHELTVDLARLLNGERGGIFGIRWNAEQNGRGIGGEGYAERTPVDKRMIKVGLGEWYKHAKEWKAIYAEAAREADVDDAFEVFGVDQGGKRTDGKEWSKQPEMKSEVPATLEEHIALRHPDVDLSAMTRRELMAFRTKHILEYSRELAVAKEMKYDYSVLAP
ncbi:hypothetical protein DAEQUDRAFT_728962 [Daedalea quercina L-15889]|uniref:Uncharacterized protein n=1 Tax=Daedalea quercina L-15889 TaxID=1314783 RepID=A0A165NYC9_9APHY|nr:hypothetical protein DAEQUDRAFT_728962 [Daedalea quercina L-15889]